MINLQKEFQEREVVVEFDVNKRKIFCIGERERDVLAVKNTMKNCLESMVTVVIKYNDSTNEEVVRRANKAN